MNHKPSSPSPITHRPSPVVYIHTYIHTYIHKLTSLFYIFLSLRKGSEFRRRGVFLSLIIIITGLMFLPAVSVAAISLSVTPPCTTANTASSFTFQTQAATAGGGVQFELFFDFNSNGTIDGDEWPICTQLLVDNETVGEDDCFTHDSNPSSPDITTNLDTGSAYLPVGNYIVRVQNSLSEVATAQLCVTAVSAPRTVTGTVYEQGTSTPVPNTLVDCEDVITEEFISAAITDSSGFYTLQMPVTSAVEICSNKYGYLGPCSNVTVPPGGISNLNLHLIPTDTQITGTVREAGTGNPVWGAEVDAETTDEDEKETETTTDINGNFTLPVLSGVELEICFEKYGYLEICRDVTVPSGGISNYNVYLTPLDAEVTGTVTEYGTGNPLQGVEVYAETIDGKGSETVTDINGNFSLPVLSGIEWRVSSDEPPGYFGIGTPENNYAHHINITPSVGGSNIVNFITHKETAWIEATVLDEYGEKPVKGALFSAFRINVDANVNPELWWLDNGRRTNASGQATVGVEAGDWRVSLCLNCHERPVYVGGEQKEMVPPPLEDVLNLTTGEHREKTLKAYYADGVLVGRVFREDGRTPAPEGIGVSARSSNALNGAGQTPVGINTFGVTDKDGYFRIPVLSGTWTLEASFWGRTSFPIEVTLITDGDDVIEPGETSTDINLIVPLEIWNEVCDDGIDNDGDGFADCNDPECCEDPICFGNPACRIISENLLAQKATLDDVEVSGDYTSTLDFTNFEIVRITTGAFAGKGFSKGSCVTTLDGTTYTGEWKGAIFRKPLESQDRKIYLKGAISGEITATVEGYLTESLPESGIYDRYQATWQIGRLKSNAVSKIVNLNGDVSYQSSSEYPNTKLYIVQDNIETTPSGHYDPIPLNIVLTHLRVISQGNPHYGEGFSIISYTSNSGAGQGWTYDRLVSSGVVQLKGLFTSPFYGIVSATLDESALPRTLFLTIERIDLALPPLMADLEVKTWGPERVSPGQTVDYLVEYRNDGVVSAEDAVIVLELPSLAQYLSSTNEGIYRWETHEAFWKLGTVLPGQRGILSARVYYPWGLPEGTPQLTLAMYGTTSTEKDFFLNPDREPLFDLQEYLDYQPLEITSENILTPEEFADELASDARFNDLHQYAIELGYSDLVAIKRTLNDSSIIIQVSMKNISNEVIFLTKTNETSILSKSTDTGVSLFDREGGMVWDLINDTLQCEGTWCLPISSSEEATVKSSSISYADCLRSCTIDKGPTLGPGTKTSCTICAGGVIATLGISLFGGGPVAPALIALYKTACIACPLAILYELMDNGKNLTKCINDCKKKWSCTDHKFDCRGNDLWWQKCENGVYSSPAILFANCADIEVLGCGNMKVRMICHKDACVNPITHCGDNSRCKLGTSTVCLARDPNIKYGPSGAVVAGQTLNYKIEFENEGEGIAFGVYFTDTLDEDLDASTLVIGPVIQIIDGVVGPEIGAPGTYDPKTRTITWFISGEGEIGPNVGGFADLSVNVRADAPRGTEIINFGTVYFPSVPEETRTNAIVSIIPLIEDCSDGIDNDGDGLIDCDDPECSGQACVEVCDDGIDNDGDGFVDCADTDCPPCPEICDDGMDNDRDELVDCDDPDCVCCDSTNYGKGTSSITFKGGKKDSASLQMCVNRAFCDALRQKPKALILRLDDCNEITIPGNKLRSDRGKTKFSARSSTYTLVIDCKKGVMSLRLGKAALKACISNPVKMCVSIKDGPCLCAERVFVEKRDKKKGLVGLSLRVTRACTP